MIFLFFLIKIKMLPKKFNNKTQGQSQYPFLFQIPQKNGRYLIIDTETTGIFKGNYLTEIGGIEMINGFVTEYNFNAKFDPIIIKKKILNKNLFKNVHEFEEAKNTLNLFRIWVGNSIVFAHNAIFDLKVLNRTLAAFKLEKIPEVNFRCTMHIFLEIISVKDPLFNKNFISLKECCQYYGLKTFGKNFHTAKTDVSMLSKLLLKLYGEIDTNPKVSKLFDYNNQDDLHYIIYKNLKKINHKINSYNDKTFLSLLTYEMAPFLKGNEKLPENALNESKEVKIKKMADNDIKNGKNKDINNLDLSSKNLTDLDKIKGKNSSSDIVNKILSEYEDLNK